MKLTAIDDDGVGHDGRVHCFAADPRPYFPAFGSLINPAVIAPVNQYGALGFSAVRQNPAPPTTVPPWFTCPFTDWQDGPAIEGTPQVPIFTYRWGLFFNLHTGLIYYRRAGTPLVQAPLALFPAPLPVATSTDFTICFDANARPVFAYADTAGGTVNMARFVAGVPTFNTFAGSSPKLIYDGQMQRDSLQDDVVIYYLRGGILRARFQRDTFGIEYTIADVTGVFGAMTRLTKTDRNVPAGAPAPVGNPIFQYMFALCGPLTEIELQAGPYPVWPISVSDDATMQVPAGPSGIYLTTIVPGGSYVDNGSMSVPAGPSGVYTLLIVPAPPAADDGSMAVTAGPTGAYTLVIVTGGTYTDDGSLSVPAGPSGSYDVVIIMGGTYTDDGSMNVPAGPSGTYV